MSYYVWGSSLRMGFLDVAFLPSPPSLPPHFLATVVEVKGQPQALKLWMWVSKGILPVEYFCSNEDLCVSVEIHGDHEMVTEMRCVWPPSVLRDEVCLATLSSER